MELETAEYDRFKAQAERFRLLAKANGIALVIWQANKGLLVSQEFTALTGWTAEQLPNYEDAANRADVRDAIDDWLENVHPDDRQQAREASIDYFLFKKSAVHKNRYRLLCANGEYMLIDISAIALWEQAKIIGVDLTVRPVGELQVKVEQAEATAKHAEETAEQNEKIITTMNFWAKRLIPAAGAVCAAAVVTLTALFVSVKESMKKISDNQVAIDKIAEDTSNLRLAPSNYEIPLFNQRAFEITQLLQRRAVLADLIFVGAYYPKDLPLNARVFAQYRKSSKTPWLTTEPEAIRRDTSDIYNRATWHFSVKGAEIYERRFARGAETFIEYSVSDRLPGVEGWQPFYVGVQIPASATDETKREAQAAVRSLKEDLLIVLKK